MSKTRLCTTSLNTGILLKTLALFCLFTGGSDAFCQGGGGGGNSVKGDGATENYSNALIQGTDNKTLNNDFSFIDQMDRAGKLVLL
jgi:hypothetical protein